MDRKPIRFELRLQPKLSRQIDEWRRRQPDLPSKSEAVRRLIETGLGAAEKNTATVRSQDH